jgi:hypothetical protein
MNLLFQVRPNLGIRLLASFRGHTSAFTVDMGLSATALLEPYEHTPCGIGGKPVSVFDPV